MASGNIFDLQRYVSRSGSARAVVYFKGCPLRCLWCSNPESLLPEAELMLRPELCVECGMCEDGCAQGAVMRAPSGARVVDRLICKACGVCAELCPAKARTLCGRTVSVENLLRELNFDAAGHGPPEVVSLSGGEPLFQPVFAADLLRTLRRQGLRTVLETCGHASWLDLARVLPYTDLVLFDIKTLNPYSHRRLTGVRGDLILSNLERLASGPTRVVLRMPLVPGCNADADTVLAVARLARQMRISDLHLLPYHRHGEWKYRALSRGYPLDGAVPLSEEVVNELRTVAQGVGSLSVRVSG